MTLALFYQPETMYTVYKHTTPSGKCYIGITGQIPEKRWLNGKGYQKQDYFYKAILKYGWDNIEHEILLTGLTKEEAEQKEVELIKSHKSNQREFGYNIERGGHIGKMSDETIEKIRKANTGKHHSPETRERLRELEKERWKNPEYRENQIQKRLGKPAWNKGLETPAETREKQRQKKLGKYKGKDHWNAKPVINLDTGEVYESIGLLAEYLNIANGSHIVSVCKGQRKTAYGYRWAYYKGGDAKC